jgi:hypothetical protein
LGGAHHGGLVDEDDVLGADRARQVDVERAAGVESIVGGEPCRDIGGVGDAVLAQDLGGVLRDGEAVDPAVSELLPGARERAGPRDAPCPAFRPSSTAGFEAQKVQATAIADDRS